MWARVFRLRGRLAGRGVPLGLSKATPELAEIVRSGRHNVSVRQALDGFAHWTLARKVRLPAKLARAECAAGMVQTAFGYDYDMLLTCASPTTSSPRC